jgi:hypothetical protein
MDKTKPKTKAAPVVKADGGFFEMKGWHDVTKT